MALCQHITSASVRLDPGYACDGRPDVPCAIGTYGKALSLSLSQSAANQPHPRHTLVGMLHACEPKEVVPGGKTSS